MKCTLTPNDIFSDKMLDLDNCHKVLFGFRDILTDKDIKKYYQFLDVILLQYQMKSLSLINLLKGTEYNRKRFYDIPSFFILLRSLIENYLMFNYLFIQPTSKEEIIFRNLIYKRSGLKNRQKIESIPKDDPIRKREAEIIKNLTFSIENHTLYNKLNAKAKNRINNKYSNNATIMSYYDIFESTILKDTHFFSFWRLCSNFAHSEYISIMQIKSIYIDKNNPNDIFTYKHNILLHSIYLIVLIINDFRNLFPELNSYYEKNPFNIISIANEFDIKNYSNRIKQY